MENSEQATPTPRVSDRVPYNEELLPAMGRVNWCAVSLHHVIRDKINELSGVSSDDPFNTTLGVANRRLRNVAYVAGRQDIVDWCDAIADKSTGAIEKRNGLTHAITITNAAGEQALAGSRLGRPKEYKERNILDVADALTEASLALQLLP